MVLDSDTGREILPPLSHEAGLQDALWSPDGKLIITAAGSAGVRAWDATSGKITINLPCSNAVDFIAISPDGMHLATAQEDKTVQFWQIPTGHPEGPSFTVRETVHQMEFSPDGKRLAIATDARAGKGVVELRDVHTGEVIGKPLAHRDSVQFFEFSRNGRWISTASGDHTARVWDGLTGEPVSPLLPQDFEGRLAVFSPDGERLATIARRGTVRLWNSQTGEPLSPPIDYARNEGTGWVSYSPDGKRLLIARGGDEAWVRELQPEMASVEQLRLLAEAISCTRFDPISGTMVPMDETSLDQAWMELRALRSKQ